MLRLRYVMLVCHTTASHHHLSVVLTHVVGVFPILGLDTLIVGGTDRPTTIYLISLRTIKATLLDVCGTIDRPTHDTTIIDFIYLIYLIDLVLIGRKWVTVIMIREMGGVRAIDN